MKNLTITLPASNTHRISCAVHKDLRTPKYKMQVQKPGKGKGSFRRNKRVEM